MATESEKPAAADLRKLLTQIRNTSSNYSYRAVAAALLVKLDAANSDDKRASVAQDVINAFIGLRS